MSDRLQSEEETTTITYYEGVTCFDFINEAREILFPNFCIAFHQVEQLHQQIEREGGTVYPTIHLRHRIIVKYSFFSDCYCNTVAVRYQENFRWTRVIKI